MRFAFASVLVASALLAGCPGEPGLPPGADAGDRGDGDLSDVGDPGPDAPGGFDGGDDGDAPIATTCALEPACDAPLPDLGATSGWRHSIATPITVAMGAARHRGRDLYLRDGDSQWALAKFAYGALDDDLKDEDVDVYLLRGCTGTWEPLGTATTTDDGDHVPIEGVEDTGGRVYFPIPASATLGIGRHRVLFVVRGDHTTAEQFIEVLPSTARFVVTDVDGTQTESEAADWASVLGGPPSGSQPFGAELLHAYAARGYRIFYLTARPDWLHAHTHEWLRLRGYPAGNVHTTLSSTGALGAAAQTFKTDEIAVLLARFPGSVEIAIGNTDTDAGAYAASGLAPSDAYLYRFDPGPIGTRVDDYATLLPRSDAAALACSF
jgi:hypothetical protein